MLLIMRTITPTRLNLEPESYYKPNGTKQPNNVTNYQKRDHILKFLKYTIMKSAKTFKLIKVITFGTVENVEIIFMVKKNIICSNLSAKMAVGL